MDETLPPSKPVYAGSTEPVSPRPQEDAAPATIGPYRVVEKLGTGSMGIVYRCHDATLHRDVAVKVLRRRYSDDEHYRRRFQREAKAIASLSHPCVVSIHSIQEEITDSQHLTYIVMELVEGHSADARLHADGAIPLERAARWIRDAATGLRAAAAKDLIHRDVKPSNLLVTDAGDVKIVDFGLAKDLAADNTLTEDGIVLGTPHYISPEQGRGRRVDHRSDIYSLGATFYHLITGHPPFERDSQVSVIVAHVSEAPRAPHETQHDLPVSATQVAFRMLAKSADDRYSDYDTLIEDLDALVEGKFPPHASGHSIEQAFSVETKLPIWRRPRWVAASIALLTLFTGLRLAPAFNSSKTSSDEEAAVLHWSTVNQDDTVNFDLDLDFEHRPENVSIDDVRRHFIHVLEQSEPPAAGELRPEIRGNALRWSNFSEPFAIGRRFERLDKARLSIGATDGKVHLRLRLAAPSGPQVRRIDVRLAVGERRAGPLVQAFRAQEEVPLERLTGASQTQRIPLIGNHPFDVVVNLKPDGKQHEDTRFELSLRRGEKTLYDVVYRIPGNDWSKTFPILTSESILGSYSLGITALMLQGELAQPISGKEATTWRS